MKTIRVSLFMFIWLTVLTGVVYPLIITGIGWLVFPKQSEGTFISNHERIIGSRLIGQKFESDRYFWSRPSANDYDALASGGRNLGPTRAKLLKKSVEIRDKLVKNSSLYDSKSIPGDLIYSSGSGLDPHITPQAAHFQLNRIVMARGINTEEGKEKVRSLIDGAVDRPFWRYLGHDRVNVLSLNQELDELTNNGR